MQLLSVIVAADLAELTADRCWTAGAAGVWEIDQADGRVELRAGTDDPDRLCRALADLHPVDITDRVAVDLATRTIELVIAGRPCRFEVPPTVFGDGNHPTTRTCVDHLERCVVSGHTVLDVGCGSGVLSVTAALAGAEVRAIDIDPSAAAATLANAAANGVAVAADTTPLDGIASGAADVVVANISAATILANAAQLRRVARREAWFVLSGMLDHQWPDVRADFEAAGARLVTADADDGWTTATMRCPST